MEITHVSLRLKTPVVHAETLCFQDLRLFRIPSLEDATVCNNEKLESGSTHAFVTSSRMFLAKTLFKDEGPWPTAVFAPSNLNDRDSSPNLQITVSVHAFGVYEILTEPLET